MHFSFFIKRRHLMLEYLFEFADALVLYNTAIKNLNTFVIQSNKAKLHSQFKGVKKNLCYISCTCKHIYHKDLIFIAKLYAVYYLELSFFSDRQPVKNTLIRTKFHTLVWPFCKIQIFFHKKFVKILKYW